jgi:hypothetical protein
MLITGFFVFQVLGFRIQFFPLPGKRTDIRPNLSVPFDRVGNPDAVFIVGGVGKAALELPEFHFKLR